jgi:predicted nucleic-acid-binding protein
MRGLDSNVLIRYLVQDDPIQSPKATERIERRLTEETPGFVSIVAMVEIVWVLDRSYGLDAQEIAAAVERMLGRGARAGSLHCRNCAQAGEGFVR